MKVVPTTVRLKYQTKQGYFISYNPSPSGAMSVELRISDYIYW